MTATAVLAALTLALVARPTCGMVLRGPPMAFRPRALLEESETAHADMPPPPAVSDGPAQIGGGDISGSCSLYPGKRIVLVTVNEEFVPFFENWLLHAKPYLGSTEQVVAVAEDAGALEPLRRLAAETPFEVVEKASILAKVVPRLLAEGVPAAAGAYNSMAYGELVNARPFEISHFLSFNCTVLYADIDTVWLKDPFQHVAAAGKHDMYIGEDRKYVTDNRNHWNFCTCFMYMQPTESIQRLMRTWHQTIPAKTSTNQGSFNVALQKDFESVKTVDFAALPRDNFPPGPAVWNLTAQSNTTVLHANYLAGKFKKYLYLKTHHHWQAAVPAFAKCGMKGCDTVK